MTLSQGFGTLLLSDDEIKNAIEFASALGDASRRKAPTLVQILTSVPVTRFHVIPVTPKSL